MYRNLLRATTWLALTAITAGVGIASDRAFPRAEVPTSVVVRQDIVYLHQDGHRLSLDLYLPPGGTRRPAILAIHGGSWIGGSRRLFRPSPWIRNPTAVRMAEEGFVVVAADYRLARPGVPGWPAALDDLREAVRWIRRHADELAIDPSRIAAFGQSAGGHLATMVGTSAGLRGPDDEARVQAVISFSGPSDLERLPDDRIRSLRHEPVHTFLGPDESRPSEKARDASPIHHVRGDAAPMLLVHGTRDLWVPIAQAEALARALEAAGVRHRLVRVEGARHGFDAVIKDPDLPDPRDRDLLRSEIFAFLRNVWNAPSR
jgi:acetyl esterase/lipase